MIKCTECNFLVAAWIQMRVDKEIPSWESCGRENKWKQKRQSQTVPAQCFSSHTQSRFWRKFGQSKAHMESATLTHDFQHSLFIHVEMCQLTENTGFQFLGLRWEMPRVFIQWNRAPQNITSTWLLPWCSLPVYTCYPIVFSWIHVCMPYLLQWLVTSTSLHRTGLVFILCNVTTASFN